jgi:hypothetical protein
MNSAILDAPDDCISAGLQVEDAQCATREAVANPTKSFVQRIFRPPERESEFEEGRAWLQLAPDQYLAPFQEHLREAEDLETKIVNIENEADELLEDTDGRLDPLKKSQIVACLRAWKLVADGKVPASVMDEYVLAGGVKAHGNEKIPPSRLMRAIVATGVIKGTRTSQRKRARASAYASAIDYAIRQGMTEEAFTAELDRQHKRGEHHGIEHLAAQGRKARQSTNVQRVTEQLAEALNGLEDAGGFLISGDFSDVEPGYRFIVINVPAETTITETRGQIIDPVDDALVQRILRQWIKARPAMAQDANAT